MSLSLYIYEDKEYRNFFPLTCLRPVYELRPGIRPIFKRLEQKLQPADTGLLARDDISAHLAARQTGYPVNIIKNNAGDILFINGRVRYLGDLGDLIVKAPTSTLMKSRDSGKTVAIFLKAEDSKNAPPVATPKEQLELIARLKPEMMEFETTATLYNYCWEMMADIGNCIVDDFPQARQTLDGASNIKVHDSAMLINEDEISLGDNVEIMPGAILDASRGPIMIEGLTRIESFAAVYGPCFIGANSVVLAGKVSHCSIGPTCRIGGEVEETIFQSYVNKYHSGFIGHSYVGSWVNFGAMTTNSDLKNNYSTIKLTLNGQSVDSGSMKVGSFVGDHTKFGIGTLLNTGINIGVSCNIFGGGLIADKEIPSFTWGSSGKYQPYEIGKAIETVRRVCRRRNVDLSSHEEELLQKIYRREFSDEGTMEF